MGRERDMAWKGGLATEKEWEEKKEEEKDRNGVSYLEVGCLATYTVHGKYRSMRVRAADDEEAWRTLQWVQSCNQPSSRWWLNNRARTEPCIELSVVFGTISARTACFAAQLLSDANRSTDTRDDSNDRSLRIKTAGLTAAGSSDDNPTGCYLRQWHPYQ